MGRRPERSRAPLRDERGVVIVVVSLSLLALMGITVLTVDMGYLYYRRTAMQNAADAAALAAAQSCGLREGAEVAIDQAGLYAAGNVSDSAIVSGFPVFEPDCDAASGTVTVTVNAESDLFFAPILGSESATVGATAQATWGGAGAFANVAPLMLAADRLHDCDIPPEPDEEVTEQICTFFWDNSSSNPSNPNPALTNAEWGTLDLENWDVEPSTHCNQAVPSDFEEWMFTGYPGDLPITPPHTYVCRGQGNFGNALDTLIEQAIEAELSLFFPVNDPQSQIDRLGIVCPPGGACSVDKYDIIGFAQLTIVQLWSGKAESEASPCAERLPEFDMTANSRCMQALWTDYSSEGLEPTEGENFGLVPVQLVA
jgi:Flp pilus assembly protein TadG